VDCGAIATELLESELFGHKQGAFTGAVKDKEGCVKIANDGILFLDEIGNLAKSHQGKLLRFLQDGTYTPVGDTKGSKSNARVITATNKDLFTMVKEGTFRDDLYARIAGYTIRTIGLAERPEDTVCITNHLIRGLKKKVDHRVKFLLYSYHLPFNVRDLENFLGHDIEYVKSEITRRWQTEWKGVVEKNPKRAWAFDQSLRALDDNNNDDYYRSAVLKYEATILFQRADLDKKQNTIEKIIIARDGDLTLREFDREHIDSPWPRSYKWGHRGRSGAITEEMFRLDKWDKLEVFTPLFPAGLSDAPTQDFIKKYFENRYEK
jgi:transcriptional regulator with PAS, ATPase and Fis domain